MLKYQTSYLIEGKPNRQYLLYPHPTGRIDPTDTIRAIVAHEFPNEADPFPAEQHTTRRKVLRKFGISGLKYVRAS